MPDTDMPPSRRQIGVMGGSFNPIHTGHLMLASYICQNYGLSEVWLVLSPLNPLKAGDSGLLPDEIRMDMLRIAVKPVAFLKACDVELSMPKPSYTVDTLAELSRSYPDVTFRLIIGADNWAVFDKWKDYGTILENYGVMVYPRPGCGIENVDDSRVTVIEAPQFDVSSTFIRRSIAEGKDMNFFLPVEVYNYIKDNNLYKNYGNFGSQY